MTDKEIIIENAQIERTSLGREDHGIMTFDIQIKFASGGCCYGGYALDEYNPVLKERVCTSVGFQAIDRIMQTVGVDHWEDLCGKYIRVKHNGFGGRIFAIGNFMEDKWFCAQEFFEQEGNT